VCCWTPNSAWSSVPRRAIATSFQTPASAYDLPFCTKQLPYWNQIPKPTADNLNDPTSIYYDVMSGSHYHGARDKLQQAQYIAAPHRSVGMVVFEVSRWLDELPGAPVLFQLQYDLSVHLGFTVSTPTTSPPFLCIG
jgi:hypothetical protein